MAKQVKLTFNGAAYLLTGTGEYKINICGSDEEFSVFLDTMEETIRLFNWTLHAFCLTPGKYDLLVDTPQGNLPDCMRYFQSTYAQRIQRIRGTSGYFFRNYEAKPVEATPENLAAVSTFIHLEPACKKRIDLQSESLSDYPWSSCRFYLRPSDRPIWLSVRPVLDALELSDNRSGLTRYRNVLKKTVAECTTASGSFRHGTPYAHIQKDWAIGSDEFKNRLLDLLEEKLQHISSHSVSGGMKKAHELRTAERCLQVALDAVKLSPAELRGLKKMDLRKQAVCWYLKQHTQARSAWISKQLHMGVVNNTSLAARNVNRADDGPLLELRNTLQNL